MKAELNIDTQELVDAIADKVIERLKPFLARQATEDVILNIGGAGKLLDKSKEQIYQWVNQSKYGLNDFPYMKAGKSLRFSKHRLLEWMQKRANGR